MTVADTASRWLADAPATWPDPPPMSTLHAILLFAGVPALIFAVVTLLVLAPSLAKGPRYRLGQEWDAQPEWFGDDLESSHVDEGRRVTTGEDSEADRDQGGASARW